MAHRSVCCRLNGSGSCVAVAVAVAAAPPLDDPHHPPYGGVCVCAYLRVVALNVGQQSALDSCSCRRRRRRRCRRCRRCNAMQAPLPRRKQIQKHTHSHMHAPPSPPTLNNHVTRVHDVPHLMIPFTRREACNYHGRGLRPRTVVGGKSRNTTKVYRFFAIFWEI